MSNFKLQNYLEVPNYKLALAISNLELKTDMVLQQWLLAGIVYTKDIVIYMENINHTGSGTSIKVSHTSIAQLELGKLGHQPLRAFKVLSFSILAQHSRGLNLPTSIKKSILYFAQSGPFSQTRLNINSLTTTDHLPINWLDVTCSLKYILICSELCIAMCIISFYKILICYLCDLAELFSILISFTPS